jgi:catechol 2,3-dioxygenase-like lactoylglutathione lyase family enzyme
MILRPDHINIVVSNLLEAEQFFLQLGFRKIDSAHLTGEWISSIVGLENVEADYVALEFPGSTTRLELIHYSRPKSTADPGIGRANSIGFRHLAFTVDNIEEEVEKLKKSGIRFLSNVHVYEKSGKKLVYFHGPDNILLELAEYP